MRHKMSWVSGERRSGRRAHIICSSFDLLVEFVLVLVPEWRVSNQEDVKDHTYTPKHNRCVSDKKVEVVGGWWGVRTKSSPQAQMSTGLPYASFLSTSGDK